MSRSQSRLNGSVVELKFVEKSRGHSIEGVRHFSESLTRYFLIAVFSVKLYFGKGLRNWTFTNFSAKRILLSLWKIIPEDRASS